MNQNGAAALVSHQPDVHLRVGDAAVTFIDAAAATEVTGPQIRIQGNRGKAACRIRLADEDGARRALGADPQVPAALLPGSALEHLARIALG